MNPIWYHIIGKDKNIQNGILSPWWLYYHQQFQLFDKAVDKYRKRMVGPWGVYPNRKADSLSRRELLLGLERFRGEGGSKKIYLFRYPLSPSLGPNMKKLLSHKDMYAVNLSLITDIVSIDYGHIGSCTDNPKLSAKYYDEVSYQEYFAHYDDNAPLLFASINHIGIIPASGRIPNIALTQIAIKS